jgi:hypothetical protein
MERYPTISLKERPKSLCSATQGFKRHDPRIRATSLCSERELPLVCANVNNSFVSP